MKIKANVQFKYKNNETARIIKNTLDVDNEEYLESEIDDNKINYHICGDNLSSFLNTIDDLISCEIVSEKIIS